MATTTRTYQTHAIRWARGSVWSGYATAAEAEATVAFAASHGGDHGVVETSTFTVEIPAGREHLYQPGIA